VASEFMSNGSYGQAFGRLFGVDTAPALVSGVLRKSEVAVTFLRQEAPTFELSEAQPVEDAYLLSMGLLDFPGYTLFEDGRQIRTQPVMAPQITLYDLRATQVIRMNDPMVGLHFHIPRAALDALAEQAGAPRIGALTYAHGAGIDDPVIHHLGMALLPAFRRPEAASRLFLDHVTLAVAAHVAHTYGAMRAAGARRGGLAPWQERLATDVLDANLDGEVSHALLARECGLSSSHFARAFKVSMGMPPHQWLLHRRVDRAKAAMRETSAPLAAVAAMCGFADQSHFTRVFTRIVGVPPGAWRGSVRS
jgi:AraC family transcriptional regulator